MERSHKFALAGIGAVLIALIARAATATPNFLQRRPMLGGPEHEQAEFDITREQLNALGFHAGSSTDLDDATVMAALRAWRDTHPEITTGNGIVLSYALDNDYRRLRGLPTVPPPAGA